MNSCILMAEIVQEPQLRYTPDQTPLAEMLVQFPGLRAEDQPATLKVVGWGNLAQEVQQNYHQGDRVIIEGRLSMNTVERPEGFKEKRAELTISKIYPLGAGVNIGTPAVSAPSERNATAPGMERTRPQATPTYTPAATPSNSGAYGTESPRTPVATPAASPVGVAPQYEPAPSQPTPSQVPAYPVSTPEADVDDIPF